MPSPTPGYEEPTREGTWSVTREHLADSATVRSTSAYRLPLGHVTFDYSEDIEAAVDSDDPQTARISNDLDVELEYGHETVRTRVSSRVTHDTAQVQTSVDVDGQPVFDDIQRWTR
jgi:hypothetical protein